MKRQEVSGEIQDEVTALLKREVVLMREILANMYEEERALLEKNPKALQAVMLERDKLLQDLKDVREEISSRMRDLILSSDSKNINLTNLLETKGFETCEVMLLADQIIALIEKMNVQSSSISHLMEESHPYWKELMQGTFVLDVHHPSAFRALEEKRKGIMLSVEIPENEK